MLGGDLRFHLDRIGYFSEDVVRFYAAELSSAIAYLHEKRIVHRDLKPDNILLDERGHAHITDFNIAVHYSERRLLTSIAGSMAYMAPEVLNKKGYTYTIDYWSLGVCLYELLFGRRPFKGRTNSDLTHSIAKDHLRYPEGADKKYSREGLSAIKHLLDRDVTRRLGCRPHGEGFAEIQSHPWFRTIAWEDLKGQESPFIPDSKKANFDATHELEELLLEDNPLKARKRNPNQDISTLSAEMRQMEEQFTSYDFKTMNRRSYYPHNQQLVSTITAASTSGFTSSRPNTPGETESNSIPQVRSPDDFIPPIPSIRGLPDIEKAER